MAAGMIFGYPLTGDHATLSGGSWETDLPLTNLQDALLASEAHSVDADLASTIINVDQGGAQEVSLVALDAHNFRNGDQWRVRMSASNTMSAPGFDSGWVDIWGPQWPVGLLPSGHPNAATRKLTDAQIARTPRGAIMILPQVVQQYLRIELDVTGNADGYARAGRLSVAPRYTPRYNFSVGAEFGFVDNDVAGKSMSGVKYVDQRPKARSLSFSFTNLPDAEAYAVLRDMAEDLGQAGQFYLVQDPTDVEMLQRRAFLASLRQLNAVQYAAAGYSSFPMVADEVL